jgi:glycosyltransferase involved in cell wall biosynthesis
LNKISVICPTFNSSNFIDKTIQSLIDQDTRIDEVIFSDDGSQDNTIDFIKKYIRNNKPNLNYKIITNTHKGPGAARNSAIMQCSHDWIAFIDSDDTWEKNKMSEVKKTISENKNVNFICHDEYFIKLNGDKVAFKYSKKLNKNKNLISQIYLKNKFSTSAITCKKCLFAKNNIYFDESLMSSQDHDLWIRLSPYLQIFFLENILGNYVERLNNITSSKLKARFHNDLIITIKNRKLVNIFFLIYRVALLFSRYLYYTIMSSLRKKNLIK